MVIRLRRVRSLDVEDALVVGLTLGAPIVADIVVVSVAVVLAIGFHCACRCS